MPFGTAYGFMFFLLLAVAAWTSSISLLEPATAYLVERTGLGRKLSALIIGALAWLAGMASVLGFTVLKHVQFGKRDIMGTIEHTANDFMMPLGGMLIAIFAGWVLSRRLTREELGSGMPAALFNAWLWLVRIVTPLLVLVVLAGMLDLIRSCGPEPAAALSAPAASAGRQRYGRLAHIGKIAQHPAAGRCLFNRFKQRPAVQALGVNGLCAGFNIAAHDVGAEFGMKLHAPGARPKSQGVEPVAVGAGNKNCVRRLFKHHLFVGDVESGLRRQLAQQVVVAIDNFNAARADAAAVGVGARLAAQGAGQKLMAIAHAQNGQGIGCDHVGQPPGGALRPVEPVRHHGPRTGNDNAGIFFQGVRCRQSLAVLHINCFPAEAVYAYGAGKPVVKVSKPGFGGRQGRACLDNEYRSFLHGL